MFRSPYLATLILGILLAGLTGCGADEPNRVSELPPPGTLEVVSIRPLEGDLRQNLITNGAFDEWYAGAPAPTGFTAPDPAHSTLRRDAEVPTLNPLGFRAIQRWKKNDADTGVEAHFGAWVPVQPGAEYELRVIASSWNLGVAGIDIYEELPEGETKLLVSQAIAVEPDVARKEYTKTFTAGTGARIFISSSMSAGVEPTGDVVWHDWYLY